MKNLHSYSLFLFFSVIVTLFVAGAYIYVYRMTYQSANSAGTAMANIRNAKDDAAHNQTILNSYQQAAVKWDRLQVLFVPADKVLAFIKELEALGPRSGSEVALTAISADDLDGASIGTIGSVGAHVGAQGSWSAVMGTLMLAEALPHPAFINNVNINLADTKGSSSWVLSFDIKSKEMVMATSTE